METLGIILARGGSKRVPGKNKRPLGGVPLICWTIETVQASDLEYLAVSSDDEEILDIARSWDTGVIRRPKELATDDASSYGAILHTLEEVDHPFEYVCLLQPTSPFRAPIDINTCLEICHEVGPAVVSMQHGSTVPNGAIYVSRVDWLRDALLLNDAPFDGPVPSVYYMPPDRSLDIDTEEDFEEAEAFVRSCRG
jgi:CMP-N-acetylneuraminic acid synthetase